MGINLKILQNFTRVLLKSYLVSVVLQIFIPIAVIASNFVEI